MSIWKLRVGVENYYLGQVAEGLGDYYSGRGEMAGRWVGTASSGLGLGDDPVAASELRAVLAGLAPGTGLTPNGDQLRTFKGRVPGFDLTFAAPKSVSVLYALGDALVVTHVVEAHDRAVDAAVAWLEREACFVRRGSNNRAAANSAASEFGTRRLPGAGFVAAAFRHRTSRAGDPHLHTHVLVANLTRGPDRKWSALDAQGLYRSKHAAGAVFRSVLENELTERLGVGWRPGSAGIGEVAGIATTVIRTFSKRRAEIEARMAADGTIGAAAAADAMLATRTSKEDVDPETLRERWSAEAAEVGFDTATLDTLLAGGVTDPGDRLVIDGVDLAGQRLDIDDTAAAFAGRVADAMIVVDSTCTRHQILGIVADLLPGGVSAQRLEQLTAWVLAQPELLPVPPSTIAETAQAGWEQRWTSRRLIAIEQAMIDVFTAPTVAARVDQSAVVAQIVAAGLGVDQAAVVAHVTSSGRPVDVIVGRAGTGKTYTMHTVRTVFESAGYRVVGVAPSARAARELGDGAGIDAYTFPRFTLHAEAQLTDRHVVIVDEAGMAGTLDLHHVLTAAGAVGAKVILVGDHHQLPEISAGGGLAAAIEHVPGGPVELTVNRRQVAEWEHTALDHLRHGRVLDGYHLYADHGHVTVADTVDAVHAAAVDDWLTAYRAGCDAILLAGTRSEARTLNQQARARLADTLVGPVLTIGRHEFQVGDRVVLLRNDAGHRDLDTGRTCRVDNGMLATITRIGDGDDVDVTLLNGRRIRVRHDYLTAGHLDYGYATTIHKAQGVTCDQVFVVGPAGLYREAVYVAMSRARDGARLYATSRQAADLDTPTPGHGRGIVLPSEHADEPDYDLRQALQASRAKQFAISRDRHLQTVADLADSTPLDVLWERHIHLRRTARSLVAAGHIDPTDMIARLERAQVHRRFMTVGGRVNAADWDNLGTIVAIFDTTGTALATFTSADGERSATRIIDWADLRPVDRPDEHDLTPAAVEWLQLAEQAVAETVTEWDSLLAAYGIGSDEAHTVPAAIEMRRQRATHTLIAANPDWLTWWYGTRPDDPAGAQVWDDAIARVAAWRDARHHTAETPGYGPAPDNPDEHRRWVEHLDHSLTTRTWLHHHHHPTLTPPVPLPVDIVAVRERLAQLNEILAAAPVDQTRIIDAITTGQLAPADIHQALADAAHTQTARNDWILEHWPHIVEHTELTAISTTSPTLAHWPTPVNPAVDGLYQRLHAVSHDTPDTQSLVDLDRQLDDADPEHQLVAIDTRVADLTDTRRRLEHARTQGDPIQQQLLDSHLGRIDARLADLDRQARIQRSLLILWNLGSRPDHLTEAIDNRINHLTHHAITTRPAWLDTVLGDWHTHHPDNDIDDLHDRVSRIAAWRERTGRTGNDPIGPPPSDRCQLDHWQHLDNMTIGPPAEMQISDLL